MSKTQTKSPGKSQLTTQQCPKCGQTLPGWAGGCQFCGTQFAVGYARPTGPQVTTRVDNRMSWKEVAYYVFAVIWFALGAFHLLQGFGVIPMSDDTPQAVTTIAIVFGAIDLAVGLGLLFSVEIVQTIAFWWSVRGVLFSLLGLLYAFGNQGRFYWAIFLGNLFELAFCAMQAYILKEIGDV